MSSAGKAGVWSHHPAVDLAGYMYILNSPSDILYNPHSTSSGNLVDQAKGTLVKPTSLHKRLSSRVGFAE